MFIVLDYDETYTADPHLWDAFISSAKLRGHTLICCTFRFADKMDNFDVERDMQKHGINIVYAASHPNKWDAVRHAGYNPENAIWIDDSPHLITVSASIIFDGGSS